MNNEDRQFWVIPTIDGCGPAFETLEQAIAEAQVKAEAQKEMDPVIEAVYGPLRRHLWGLPMSGPLEVVEVRGSAKRVVWRATPRAEQSVPSQVPS